MLCQNLRPWASEYQLVSLVELFYDTSGNTITDNLTKLIGEYVQVLFFFFFLSQISKISSLLFM